MGPGCTFLCPQIYPDPELEVQVLGLAIRCIHSEEGCRWSGPLRHLQVRLRWAARTNPYWQVLIVVCPSRAT